MCLRHFSVSDEAVVYLVYEDSDTSVNVLQI